MALGISFIPNQGPQPSEQGPPADTAPLQQALQMISLRLPRISGANPIAPDALLQGRGSQGIPMPGTPEWDEFWRRLREGASPNLAPRVIPSQPPVPVPPTDAGRVGGGGPVPPFLPGLPGGSRPSGPMPPGFRPTPTPPYPDQKMY